MLNPGSAHLRPDLAPDLTPDLTQDQIERAEKILHQVLTYLRSHSRNLPPEADLALTYNLEPEADR
jgi:hypothetical protein